MAESSPPGNPHQRPLSLSDALLSYESIIAEFSNLKERSRKIKYRNLVTHKIYQKHIDSPSTDLYHIDLEILRLGTLIQMVIDLCKRQMQASDPTLQAWIQWKDQFEPCLCEMRKALRETLRDIVR